MYFSWMHPNSALMPLYSAPSQILWGPSIDSIKIALSLGYDGTNIIWYHPLLLRQNRRKKLSGRVHHTQFGMAPSPLDQNCFHWTEDPFDMSNPVELSKMISNETSPAGQRAEQQAAAISSLADLSQNLYHVPGNPNVTCPGPFTPALTRKLRAQLVAQIWMNLSVCAKHTSHSFTVYGQ